MTKLKSLTPNKRKKFLHDRAVLANQARQDKLTPEQRSEIAKKAGLSTKKSKIKQGVTI